MMRTEASVLIAIVVAVCAIELTAVLNGLNGVSVNTALAALGALAGYVIRAKISRK